MTAADGLPFLLAFAPPPGEWWNGRHAGFRCQCAISAWGFKSPLAHPGAELAYRSYWGFNGR